MFDESLSRRALALGSTIAGSLAASGTPIVPEGTPDPATGQLSGSPSAHPVNNGPASPTTTGAGGELHQNAGGTHSSLTTNQGIIVADDENQLKVGPRGPVLLEDFVLREKINHFDHERIPERVVHARGSAAHGYFELTSSLADVSKAGIFNRVGDRTPVFARFSTVAGNKGSSDTARDVRGFAVKFYTQVKLGPRRQQHSGLLYSGRDKVSRSYSFRQTGARPGIPTGPDCPRYFLGLRIAYS